MKTSLILFSLFFGSVSLAAQTRPFSSVVKNYGNYAIQEMDFVLRYDSHSGRDGTCQDCVHKTYKLTVGLDGKIHFPSVALDPKNSRHSFSLKVVSQYDRYDKQLIYSCDVLNEQLKDCEEVLAEELKILSAYSFKETPLEISLTSGASLGEWLKKINGMIMEVHVSDRTPKYGDKLGWNSQIFGSCDVSNCSIHSGAVLFVGDLGATPELFYTITAAEFPKTSMPISGVHGLQFSNKWSGTLPESLLKFRVDNTAL